MGMESLGIQGQKERERKILMPETLNLESSLKGKLRSFRQVDQEKNPCNKPSESPNSWVGLSHISLFHGWPWVWKFLAVFTRTLDSLLHSRITTRPGHESFCSWSQCLLTPNPHKYKSQQCSWDNWKAKEHSWVPTTNEKKKLWNS